LSSSIILLSLKVSALLVLFLMSASEGWGHGTTLIPMNTLEAPAQDLLYKGQLIDRDRAASLRKSGVDLSLLNPVGNDMWGNSPLTVGPENFPAEDSEFSFDSTLAGFGKETSFHRINSLSRSHRLVISTIPHRVLMTQSLLKKLNYNQGDLKRYKSLRINFKSAEEKKAFLDSVSLHTLKDPKAWVLEEGDTYLRLMDVILEPGETLYQNYFWGTLTSHFTDGRRALRALIAPLALAYFPENIDAAEWASQRILSGHLLLTHPNLVAKQSPFDETSVEDLKWIGHRIAALSAEDWRQIVAAGEYPSDIASLVYQKIVARRTHLLETLKIKHQKIAYNNQLSNKSVQKGQVIQAQFKGYASRFTYGTSEDPMRPEELVNFGLMKGFSAALLSFSHLVNKELQILTKDALALKNQQKQIEQFIEHIIKNPEQPYVRKLSSWGGPVAGINLQANRQITTGTAYGSSAPIQLVDTVGVGASLGYFRGLNGLKNIYPSLEAQVSLQRTYMHLRSLKSMGDALKVPLKDLSIPLLIQALGQVLDPKELKNSDAAKNLVEKLLEKLEDGELFTITDTLTSGLQAKATIPLQALMPMIPVGYNQNISFGAGIFGVIYKRTSLRRINDPSSGENFLQITVQSVNSATGNLSLDFNYYIKILSLEASTTQAKAQSRVYMIHSGAEQKLDITPTTALSIKELFETNSESGLLKNYPYYHLNHSLMESNFQFSFLFLQSKKMTAKHLLKIKPPAENGINPHKFERSFYTHRTLHRTGSDFFSFLNGIIGALSQGYVDLGGGGSGNPAYTPYGNAYWVESSTDAELTSTEKFQPVTISKEVWAGWKISKENLFSIFDEIDQRMKALRAVGAKISLIRRDSFASTSALEFYNITHATVFYQKGIQRLKAHLQSKSGNVYASLVELYGGEERYLPHCRDEKNIHQNSQSFPPSSDYFEGRSYPCLTEKFKAVLSVMSSVPSISQKQKTIEWQNEFVTAIQGAIPWTRLYKALGKDGYFLQVSVKGYRSGDHQARDSEQNELISSFASDSQGTIDQDAGAGALSALSEQTKISLYELGAQFLTGGD